MVPNNQYAGDNNPVKICPTCHQPLFPQLDEVGPQPPSRPDCPAAEDRQDGREDQCSIQPEAHLASTLDRRIQKGLILVTMYESQFGKQIYVYRNGLP